jgi:hypothetical protein
MAHIQSLQAAIDRLDPEGFLVDYLTLIMRKASLTLPKTLTKDTLMVEWRDCIPPKCSNITDAFIESIVEVWIDVVQEQGAKLGDNFPEECYNILINRTPKFKDHPEDRDVADAPVNDLKEVVSSISDHYQNEKKARKQKLKPTLELVEQAKAACKSEQVSPFLEAVLILAGRTDKALFPATSVPNKIAKKWESVIQSVFKLKPHEDFVDALTGTWLNLVTKHGVPTKKADLKTLLIAVKTQELSKPISEKKQTETAVSKLLRRISTWLR